MQHDQTLFGYSWDQIRTAQQGGKLGELIRASAENPRASEKDFAMLEKNGAQWLYEHQMFGVIDRLGLPLAY